jgi:hypothetical protein
VSSYPPPPAGWGASAAVRADAPDQDDAQQALRAWATHRGYQLSEAPHLDWYRRWAPLVYVPLPTVGRRELRAEFGEAKVWLLEAETFIVSFVTSPSIQGRAAIRSRLPEDAIEEMRAPFNPQMTPRTMSRWRWRQKEKLQHRTYGRSVSGVIGDAVFEAQFEVTTPSREGAATALTPALRRFLVHGCWQGCIELRPGGMIVSQYRPPRFDPDALDVSLWLLGQIYHAATAPPESGGSLPASSIRGAKIDPVDPCEMYGPPSGGPWSSGSGGSSR